MRFRGLLVMGWTLFLAATLRGEEWKFDVLYLKNGHSFDGLIAEETDDAIHFKSVSRRPGTKTVVIETVFPKSEIARIARLDDADRQELARKIDQLDRRGEREKAKMASLNLEHVAWTGGGNAWQYTGKYFVLVSNANEDLIRRVAVRLDEIFQAYTDKLGAAHEQQQATRILLYRSVMEYQIALMAANVNILNPAFYDPRKNLIVAASDLERTAGELEKLRQKHEKDLEELDQYEKRLKKHFHGQPPQAMLNQVKDIRRSIQVINTENETKFERSSRPLFAMLYHEAFHAYLDNFVYPSGETTVPRWLNEGLAQIFETALVETGELRVGHVDPKRLAAVQDAIRKKQLVPLTDLLQSEDKHFRVAHQSDALASDRYFQASWALAYFLTFDRKILVDEALDKYVQTLHRGTKPLEAFRELASQPLDQFESRFHRYMLNLRPDGSSKTADQP